MNKTADHEQLIARYLNGNLSEEDNARLFQWIHKSPENKKQFLGLKDTWDASLKTASRETEQLLKFYKRQASQKQPRTFPSWVYGLSAAAILLLGLLIGGIFHSGLTSGTKQQVESFYVPQGSRSELTLADGTKVKLNADSRLEVSPDYSTKKRLVRLTGEAYFEVQSDVKNPFTVQTDKFDVLVTGTKFNVSSHAEDRQISTTLSEGCVQLRTNNKEVILLKPGEKISFDQRTMKPELKKVRIETELAWVNGEFIFKEILFSDLIKRLERWYDVRLSYQSKDLETMVYSGSFKNKETIWQVLDALKLTSPIDYKKKNFREFELIYKPM
ncbi:FecR domain-containing protein [uncultured Sunxiuqinia sp.]|uniref:FecR family protein n=1 Tax=uncultured Sunxiuqinia sp. TaxID=1573825 RepID=UPI002608236C|nr:FecR domain-containing protein [uncultured Sunxiuqinia sp.]